MKNASGNALFMILIAVALFAALSYAVTQSGRGAGGIAREQAMLDKAQLDNYLAAVNYGVMKLEQLAGCKLIDFTPPAQQGSGSKTCTLFHPDGGGVTYRDFGLDECALLGKSMTALAEGENCGTLVYAGVSSGNRIYALAADLPATSYNNGGYDASTPSGGATNMDDGIFNTDTLLASTNIYAPYRAAGACRALGPKWYLPARSELNLLYTRRNTGVFANTYQMTSYWSSSETGGGNAWTVQFHNSGTNSNRGPNIHFPIRCVRRD